MERKRYSAEFKREAVKLASQPAMVKRQMAEDLGIHENLLRTWVRQFAAGLIHLLAPIHAARTAN